MMVCSALTSSAQVVSPGSDIFSPQSEHTHGSSLVHLPGGDVLVAWFQGSGERWADDVRIMGARYRSDTESWSVPFLMADVPDFPDINPVLFIDNQDRLWLVWYTVLANQWESSLLKYRTSTSYLQDGAPTWDWQEVIHVKPGSSTERGIQPDDKFVAQVQYHYARFDSLLQAGSTDDHRQWQQFREAVMSKVTGENMMASGYLYQNSDTLRQSMGYPLDRRIGWQTKNKPHLMGDTILLPLYSDGLEMSLFARTSDYGQSWEFSQPIVGLANIQASVLERADGSLVAYMRDNGPPPKRLVASESDDRGMSWSSVYDSTLPNPGSGSDATQLRNGNWVIALNDTEQGRHQLAIVLSEDEGKSWPYKKYLELHEEDAGIRAAYPAIIEGLDGRIHVSYSYSTITDGIKSESIRYFSCTEDWLRN